MKENACDRSPRPACLRAGIRPWYSPDGEYALFGKPCVCFSPRNAVCQIAWSIYSRFVRPGRTPRREFIRALRARCSSREYKKRAARDPGFSAIEAVVAVSILALVGIAVATFQKDVFSFNRIFSQSISAQEEMRRALRDMSAEIRAASPSSVGAYPIAEAAATSFIFYSNIDDDSLKERVRYFLDGTTLKKGVTKPTGDPFTYNPANEVIRDIVRDDANGAAPIFYYYDADYDGSSEPLSEPVHVSAIRLVKITIMVDRDPSAPPGAVMLTTQISMRNLKDNL